jgi:hypothetical protein
MTNNGESGHKRRKPLWWILGAVALLLLVFFVPSFISVNHYKSQITTLISQSLGRPVHLSSVQVRILPWPGFVLSDLSVAEDPAYGAEPVLHASTVIASIRLLALWRGRLEIGTISVDDASLNLVRAAPGHWNIDPLFRTAAAQTGSGPSARGPVRLPYLEATNLRIHFKSGVEKLPFSIVNADFAISQRNPGEWHISLRGQPARTDVSLYPEDTGELRIEASVRRAPALRQMPVHLDLDWRRAQLGQLARLVTGSDPGWRGDLTGELHLDGTADAAQIATRLRASGVHRAEFVPVSPLDFDATCNFLFHYTHKNLENLACDSPLGDGRVHLTGQMPGPGALPSFTVQLDRIPVVAGLDALRTLRSGLQPDLEAAGAVSGKLAYAASAPAEAQLSRGPNSAHSSSARAGNHESRVAAGPLTGNLTVDNLALTGGGLTRPIQAPRITFTPTVSAPAPSHPPTGVGQSSATSPPPGALAGTVSIPAGGVVPLTLAMRFSLSGYQVAIRGQAGIARAREIAHAAGIPATQALESLAGDPITLDLAASGPWLPPEQILLGELSPSVAAAPPTASPSAVQNSTAAAAPGADSLSGTVTLRNVNWKADFLANHLEITDATLHLDSAGLRWDPVDFAYGRIKGTASLMLPQGCPPQQSDLLCPAQLPPTFNVAFGDLDAGSFETALLGARQPGTLISTLIERLHPSSAPPWPQIQGNVSADSLVLGPVKLLKLSSALKILPDGAEISSFDAGLLGGDVRFSGSLHRPATDQDKPVYTLNGDFQDLDAKDLGQLLGLRWTGSPVGGNGKVELSGYTDADLAASAKGSLHMEARSGAIAASAQAPTKPPVKPNPSLQALAHFDRFTADASITGGAIQLGPDQVVSAGHKRSVAATITFGDPPTVSFAPPKNTSMKH